MMEKNMETTRMGCIGVIFGPRALLQNPIWALGPDRYLGACTPPGWLSAEVLELSSRPLRAPGFRV